MNQTIFFQILHLAYTSPIALESPSTQPFAQKSQGWFNDKLNLTFHLKGKFNNCENNHYSAKIFFHKKDENYRLILKAQLDDSNFVTLGSKLKIMKNFKKFKIKGYVELPPRKRVPIGLTLLWKKAEIKIEDENTYIFYPFKNNSIKLGYKGYLYLFFQGKNIKINFKKSPEIFLNKDFNFLKLKIKFTILEMKNFQTKVSIKKAPLKMDIISDGGLKTDRISIYTKTTFFKIPLTFYGNYDILNGRIKINLSFEHTLSTDSFKGLLRSKNV